MLEPLMSYWSPTLLLSGFRCLLLQEFDFFFFNDTATTEIYTLSLHDALPIFGDHARPGALTSISQPSSRRNPSSQSVRDRKSTRLNSSHLVISYAVFCLKKKRPPLHDLP